ncbi:MAG: hypothetical protein J6B11_01110 [Spirochaetales bacterium]|nr:hypothetical protein [Spirochaetales bacterium]
MDINRIEELFEKVRTAGKIIAEYKQLLETERSKVNELKKEIVFLRKDNQTLKEENEKLKTLSSTAEKLHKDLEDKIISMLDVLPDFESIKNESSVAPVVETISPSIMEMDFENPEENFSEKNESSIFNATEEESEVGDIEESVIMEAPIAPSMDDNPFAMDENEGEFEFENVNSSVEDTKLPYFESEENIDYKNMFAFENMFETDQNSKNNEKRLGRELPKGVL